MCVKGCLTYVSRNARLEQNRIAESFRNVDQTSKYTFEVSSKLRSTPFEVSSKLRSTPFEVSSKLRSTPFEVSSKLRSAPFEVCSKLLRSLVETSKVKFVRFS